jgi:hypothetical protein
MTLYSATADGLVPMSPEDEALYRAEEQEWLTNGKRNKWSKIVRTERNLLLSQSDWTQYPDVRMTEEQKDLWATYRQALRDVPAQAGFPWTINWPTQPE